MNGYHINLLTERAMNYSIIKMQVSNYINFLYDSS